MTPIDRSSPVPMYFQLKQLLLEQIQRGDWKAGDLLPSEQELETTYGLSRTTVRQTLGELVSEGRLVRQRGKGTFVAQPKFEHGPARHRGISHFLSEQGLTPGWKLIDKKWVTAPAEVRKQLKLESGAKVLCIRRLRTANEEPIGYLVAYVPEGIAANINEQGLLEGESQNYLAGAAQMHNSRADRALEALPAGEVEAKLLNIKKGTPVMSIGRVIVSEDGTPIEYLQAIYRGDRLKYQFTAGFQNGSK